MTSPLIPILARRPLFVWLYGMGLLMMIALGCSRPDKGSEDAEALLSEAVELIRMGEPPEDLAHKYSDSLIISAFLSLAKDASGEDLQTKWGYYTQALDFAKERELERAAADISVRIFLDNDLIYTDFPIDSLLQQAAVIYEAERLPAREMDVYRYLVVSAFQKGNYRKALQYSTQAMEIGAAHDFGEKTAILHSNMALIHTKMGDYEKANEYNFNALRIFESLGDPLQIARVNLSVGTLFILLKENEKAGAYLQRALEAFREVDDLRGQSISLTNLASIYKQEGSDQLALESYQQAVAIDKQINDLQGISSNYSGIGDIYLSRGEYRTAMDYYQKSLELKKTTNDKSGEGDAYLKIASIRKNQGQYGEAIQLVRQGLELFEETEELNKQRYALETLASLYERARDIRAALPLYKQSYILKDSLIDIEKAINISLLEEKYLNEKLELENLSLKFQGELQETQIRNKKRMLNIYLIGLVLSVLALLVLYFQYQRKTRAFKVLAKKNLDLINKEQQIRVMKTRLEEEEVERTVVSISDDKKRKVLQKLEKFMEEKKIFTTSNLTIDKLAKKLNTNRTYLSQIINKEYHLKYPDYINKSRVNEAMHLLSNLEMTSRFSIEAIAKEAGFNTISNFNSVFKKHTGITPSLFAKKDEYQAIILP
ncbi:MAG: tetratricopeptide repeat protein [Bacteroidales bacterium]|nr:tetratricopeptide repeat protein [Bacteroidales bacterium]